jgi:hypothetical protein
MVDIPETEERLSASLRQPDRSPVEVQPWNHKSGVLYGIKHIDVSFQKTSETGTPGEERVRRNNKSVPGPMPPDLFKAVELLMVLREIVEEDVTVLFDRNFHAGDQRYSQTFRVAGESVTPDIGVVAGDGEDIEALPGRFPDQLFRSVSANAVILRIEIAVSMHFRFQPAFSCFQT